MKTEGTVISAKKTFLPKFHTKPFRIVFPYGAEIRYSVNGTEYTKRKWIDTKYPVPKAGDIMQLVYEEGHPEKVRIVY